MAHRLRIIFVGFLLALMVVSTGANAYNIYVRSYSSSDAGWYVENDRRVLLRLGWAGAEPLPLRQGDEVVALNGREFKNDLDRTRLIDNARAGTPYSLTVRRDGEVIDYQLRTAPFPLSADIFDLIYRLVFPVIFLLTGLAVFLLRPDEKQAQLLALLFAGFWGSDPSRHLILWDGPLWLRAIFIAGVLFANMIPAIFLHLMLVFPERSPLLRRWPSLEYLLYAAYTAGAMPITLIICHRWAVAPESAFEADALYPTLSLGGVLFSFVYIVAGLAVLFYHYRTASPPSRRKLRVVVVGTFAGILPILAVGLVLLLFSPALTATWVIVVIVAVSTVLLVPLSFAYAIVRHQVIPVRLIVRRSVQYLLARNALRIVLALPFIGLCLSAFANRHRTLAEIVFRNSIYFYLLAIVAVALSLKFRRPLRDWVDRQFFREAYNQEKILRELTEEVKRLDSMADVSRSVTQKVEQALHPEHIHLFYRDERTRDLTLNYSSGAEPRELRISEEFRLLRFMEDLGGAQDFPFTQKNNLPPKEKDWLERMGTRLIVPMTGTDGRLAGLFLLGRKLAEVPYSARDRGLLEALANQIALVHENIDLKGRVEKDRQLRHQVLARLDTQNISIIKECPRCGTCYDGDLLLCPADDSELTLTLPIERIIADRYRLDRIVGRGGMGAVYEAMDLRLNRRVAVKVLGGNRFGDAVSLRRFEREARAAARLAHPNIVTVYDYGLLSTEGAYLVMELLDGETLGAIIKRRKKIDPIVAADWFDGVLEGMKAAHREGVLHRDLKPENIFIARQEDRPPLVKILDFGLAKFTRTELHERTSITTAGVTLGTFGYMSPEQLIGAELDERSDIFSFGVILAEALTGHNPFAGKNYAELLMLLHHGSYHLTGDSPEILDFDAVLQRCLAKDPADRFSSVEELQRVLVPKLKRSLHLDFRGHGRIETKTTSAPDAQTQT